MAPVSPLYLFGRVQDLAFEQPVPGGPRQSSAWLTDMTIQRTWHATMMTSPV